MSLAVVIAPTAGGSARGERLSSVTKTELIEGWFVIASVAMKNAIKLIAVLGLALGLGGCPQGQAKVFAQSRGVLCIEIDLDELRAGAPLDLRLF